MDKKKPESFTHFSSYLGVPITTTVLDASEEWAVITVDPPKPGRVTNLDRETIKKYEVISILVEEASIILGEQGMERSWRAPDLQRSKAPQIKSQLFFSDPSGRLKSEKLAEHGGQVLEGVIAKREERALNAISARNNYNDLPPHLKKGGVLLAIRSLLEGKEVAGMNYDSQDVARKVLAKFTPEEIDILTYLLTETVARAEKNIRRDKQDDSRGDAPSSGKISR